MAPFLQRFLSRKRTKRAGTKKRVQPGHVVASPASQSVSPPGDSASNDTDGWQMIQSYRVPSVLGNERLAMSYVAEALKSFHLTRRRLDQLGTAVAEATMNAMEHGNHYNPEIPVILQVFSANQAIAVRISDKGGSSQLLAPEHYETPDIEAKLAELQSPRGWGLFLIQNMVDEMHVRSDAENHSVELVMRLEGTTHTDQNA